MWTSDAGVFPRAPHGVLLPHGVVRATSVGFTIAEVPRKNVSTPLENPAGRSGSGVAADPRPAQSGKGCWRRG